MQKVSVKSVRKSYGAVDVLKDINLDVEPGEFVVLLGPSGCGKSTLLNTIAGLDQAQQGSITIGDRDVTRLDPSEREIGMVFQSYALYPTMTVRQNLSFGLRMHGTPKPEIERRVSRTAAMLQIESLLARKPAHLSGGQRQRVAIGRAIVRDASVFLFDEPLSNLDAKLRGETRIEIKKLHQDLNCTILYVTHDQIEAMTLATRIAVMNQGKIEQFDTPRAIYERPATTFVAGFVGSPPMNMLRGRLLPDAKRVQIGDTTIDVGDYAFSRPATGGDVILGIRPEDIEVSLDQVSSEARACKVSFSEPTGADTTVWFDFSGQRVHARVRAKLGERLGETAYVRIPGQQVSLFDPSDERRI